MTLRRLLSASLLLTPLFASAGWSSVEPEARQALALPADCAAGSADDCYELGSLYAQGIGVEADPDRAVDLFRQACDAGSLEGCASLGFMYRLGQGVDSDPNASVALFRRACDGGEPAGCEGLRISYGIDGAVDEDDLELASMLQVACDEGDGRACDHVDNMRSLGVSLEGDSRDEGPDQELASVAAASEVAPEPETVALDRSESAVEPIEIHHAAPAAEPATVVASSAPSAPSSACDSTPDAAPRVERAPPPWKVANAPRVATKTATRAPQRRVAHPAARPTPTRIRATHQARTTTDRQRQPDATSTRTATRRTASWSR